MAIFSNVRGWYDQIFYSCEVDVVWVKLPAKFWSLPRLVSDIPVTLRALVNQAYILDRTVRDDHREISFWENCKNELVFPLSLRATYDKKLLK